MGVLSLRDLIVARPGDARSREVMHPEPVTVRALADEDEVAQVVARYNLLAVPVVDDEGRLRRHRHGRRRDRHGPARGLEAAPAAAGCPGGAVIPVSGRP